MKWYFLPWSTIITLVATLIIKNTRDLPCLLTTSNWITLLLPCTIIPLVYCCDQFNHGSRLEIHDPIDPFTVDYDATLTGSFILALRCIAAMHSLHSDCGVTALRCRNIVKFILTWNVVSCVELQQEEIDSMNKPLDQGFPTCGPGDTLRPRSHTHFNSIISWINETRKNSITIFGPISSN